MKLYLRDKYVQNPSNFEEANNGKEQFNKLKSRKFVPQKKKNNTKLLDKMAWNKFYSSFHLQNNIKPQ